MLRAVLGFDHITPNVGDTWMANSGYAIARQVTNSGKTIIIDSTGALGTPLGAPAGGPTQASIDWSKFMVAGAVTVVVSFRMKVIAEGLSGGLFYIGSTITGSDASWVINAAAFPAASLVLGAETFIEFEINTTALTVNVYANGVLITTIGITSAVGAAIKAGNLVTFHNVNGQNIAGQISLRDFFLIDNVTGDGFVGRQGDRRIKKLDFDLATGTGWTTSNGADLLATLKVAPETANPGFGVAPTTKVPLELSMKSTYEDTFIVEAVSVHLAGKVDAVGGITKTQVKDGAYSSTATNLKSDFTTTLKYGVPAGIFPRHPSGVRWNNANLDTASFVVVPDQVS